MTLKTRLEALEAVLLPIPPLRIATLVAPPSSAPPETRKAFDAVVADALATNDKVIVVCQEEGRFGTANGRLTVTKTEFDAMATAFTMRPSSEGRRSAMNDVMAALSGNIVGPVADPRVGDGRWAPRGKARVSQEV